MQKVKITRGLRFLSKLIITVGLISAAIAYQAPAQNVYTTPVGFTQQGYGSNQDTIISVPFTQIAAYKGIVGSVSGSMITDANSPGWPTGQWVYGNANNPSPHSTYYVIFTTNAVANGAPCLNAGAYYTITNNDAGDISVELVPTTLANVSAGDSYTIYAYQTLNTVWPNGQGVIPSTSTLSRKTLVLFPCIGCVGQNLAAPQTFYFLQETAATNWALLNASPATSNFNDQIILPDQYMRIRNSAFGPTTNIVLGEVPEYPIQIPLYTNPVASGSNQDNYVAIYRPTATSLAQSGLSNSVAISPSTLSRKDLVLVLYPDPQSQNAAFNQTYFFVKPTAVGDSGWRLLNSTPAGADAGSSNVFALGTGVIVRKVPTNVTSTIIWNSLQTY